MHSTARQKYRHIGTYICIFHIIYSFIHSNNDDVDDDDDDVVMIVVGF